MNFSRRDFIRTTGLVAGTLGWRIGAQETEKLPPVRAITRGPNFHWFGYYDKLEFDPSGRYVLGNEVSFEHRTPAPDDVIKVGMVDLQDGDKWIALGESHAWCWQQGCMLQWLPGSKSEVVWNDREGDHFVAHILDVFNGKKRTLPHPIYALSPDAKWAITPDFSRLHDVRPGYGYAGVPDANKDVLVPKDTGIWKMNMMTGERSLIFSVADAVALPSKQTPLEEGAKHWFNHLLFSPDGSRFIFLHRWRTGGATTTATMNTVKTRMFTIDGDGKNPYVLDPWGDTSHFIWRDNSHVLAWAVHPSHDHKFYLYEDRTENVEVIGPDTMTVNGHCTYLPHHNNEWILNDTYPDKQRFQHPYLFHVPTGRRIPLGHFLLPKIYSNEWRCDTHPRFSPDGTKVVIDAPHNGGRQLYLIDIAAMVGPAA